MENPEVTIKIAEHNSKNYDVQISLKDLTIDNLRMLEVIFNEFYSAEEMEIGSKMTEQEKIDINYAYRIQPSLEIRDAIRAAMLKMNPHFTFPLMLTAKRLKSRGF